MSKVLTFSRYFPFYHPRKGEPTYFVEKIWNSLESNSFAVSYEKVCSWNPDLSPDILWPFWNSISKGYSHIFEKGHTIRAGHRFKPGDWFSPRVWSGTPYRSKQIIIAPDVQVKKNWDIYIGGDSNYPLIIDDSGNKGFWDDALSILAHNDGLAIADFKGWFRDFKEPMDGQIICWNENINY